MSRLVQRFPFLLLLAACLAAPDAAAQHRPAAWDTRVRSSGQPQAQPSPPAPQDTKTTAAEKPKVRTAPAPTPDGSRSR